MVQVVRVTKVFSPCQNKRLSQPNESVTSRNAMSSFCYEAVDGGGLKTHGTIDVADQSEALRRIKEMGLFPVKIAQAGTRWRGQVAARRKAVATGPGEARLLTSRLARMLAPP